MINPIINMKGVYQHRGIFVRWIILLFLAMILGFLLIFLPSLQRAAIFLLQKIGLKHWVAVGLFWTVLYSLTSWVTLGFIESRLAHYKYWRVRPPLVLSGFLAIAFSLIFKPLQTGVSWPSVTGVFTAFLHEVVYGSIVVLFPLLVIRLKQSVETDQQSTTLKERSHQIGSKAWTDDNLTRWLAREEPIKDRTEDFLGLEDRVPRILEALYSKEQKTVGISGKYGTGKSSLISLLEKAAEHSIGDVRLWFVKVSCWGFLDSTAAQEAVLKQVVTTMREKVDVWDIRSIPNDYIKAISSAHSAAEIVLSFLRPPSEPLDHLKRLSPILNDTHARLVIVIEDVDRSGSGFDFSHIQALLYRFREVDSVSFIITADTNRTSIDFAKLCDHQEDLQHMPEPIVKDVVETIRTRLLSSHSEDVEPVQRPATLWPSRQNVLRWSNAFNSIYQHPTLPLTRLLGTPRILKSSMRRLSLAWQNLHGEVNFDELLYVTALRTAAPTAFDYLLTNYEDIKRISTQNSQSSSAGVNKKPDTTLARLNDRWKAVCQRSEFDDIAVERIIQEVLPQFGTIFGVDRRGRSPGMQKIHDKGPSNYWQRIVSEGLQQHEFRDQIVLRAIRNADTQHGSLDGLASQLLNSTEFSDRFEHFGKKFGQLFELTETLYNNIRRQYGRNARDDVPGFHELFNLAEGSEIFHAHPDLGGWAIGEIKRSLPQHIRFAGDIYHRWIAARYTDLIMLRKARAAMVYGLKNGLTKPGSPSICDCLDENDPYCLFHFLTPYDSNRSRYAPHSSDKVWKWLSTYLVNACHECPDRILPQILIVFIAPNDHVGGKNMITYNFDLKRLDSFFGPDKQKIVQAVATGFVINPNFDRNIQIQMEIAMQRAKQIV